MKQLLLKFYQYSLLVIGLVSFSSCEKNLEESPKSVAEEVFYNTKEEVVTAVNAIYSPLRGEIANYAATLEAHSDLMYGRGSWDPISQYQGLNDANITRVSGFWNGFYLTIRNANLVIANAPNGSSIAEDDINKYVAEAKFLRALTYFHMVRNWGSIPLRTEENMTVKDLPKSSVADIYSLIVSDLVTAEAALPDNPTHIGRPTQWAAKTLLSDVYLQLGRFQEASIKANEVIQSNKFSLVPITSVSDIQHKIFGPELLTTPEEVFYLKFSRLANQGNYILWISNHPSTNLYNFGGAYAVHGNATNINYVNWNASDIRKGMWHRINFGLGANTLVSAKYVDQKAVSNTGAGNDFPIYRYADVLLNYAEAAARSENTVSPAAMEALNKVHRRAYGHNPNLPSPIDFNIADYNVDAFINLVIRERGYEFVYEGKRWFELKRTGKANELIQAAKAKTIAEKHLLWPIPISEMNYNKALDPATDQNPGY